MSFDKQVDGADREVVSEVTQAVFAAAEALAVEAYISIQRGSASGRKTKKHKHTPSRPGEPPNNDVGDLARSIEALQTGRLKAEVHVTAGHAVPLEFGTSKMAARPFMRPARDTVRPQAQELVRQAVNRALRRHFRR